MNPSISAGQWSDAEDDGEMELVYDEEDYDSYTDTVHDECGELANQPQTVDERRRADPEYVEYKCLKREEAEELLDSTVSLLNDLFPPSMAKLLLYLHHWDAEGVRTLYKAKGDQVLVESHLKAIKNGTRAENDCCVCWEPSARVSLVGLDCGHLFCVNCWRHHVDVQLRNACAARLECMKLDCHLLCPEEFVLNKVLRVEGRTPAESNVLISRYRATLLTDMLCSHPNLHQCAGCSAIILCTWNGVANRPKHSYVCVCIFPNSGQSNKGHRVTCDKCRASFCLSVKCKRSYHAPTNCDVVKRWWTKCADDSETANYISVFTKDCPHCHSCIEKNGGCNHMQCSKCKFHFCWMCLKDWKSHGSQYYECSKYKENPSIAQEASSLKARRALEKYLHYYERYENHNKSLKMEEELRERIKAKIEDKVSRHEGTWIDWQYLHEAASLLTKCRYTLQYTYPFAYYMEQSAEKNLFEYQQAQLEKEIEELSWKVERAETTDRGELESQMHVAEQKRRTLLLGFFN